MALTQRSLLKPLALVACLMSPFSAAKAQDQANQIFSPIKASVEQSVAFIRLKDKKVIYEKNLKSPLITASVMKLITSAAALHHFGPNFRFMTNFYHDGSIKGPTLFGNLYIKGSGDPFLVNEKIWPMAADLRHMGIREITGDIIIDNTKFSSSARDESRKSGTQASSHAYDSPVSAFGINFNTLAFAIFPSQKLGGLAQIETDPYPIQGISIDSDIKTSQTAERKSLQITRIARKDNLAKIVARGSIPSESSLTKIYRSVDDHTLTSGELLRAFLDNENIKVKGAIKSGKVNPSAKLLYELEGHDMAFMIKGLNHFSNNYIADMLVNNLGALRQEYSPNADTLELGVEALEEFLKSTVGIEDRFIIRNGSGLDTSNKLSAEQMVKMLMYMEENFASFPAFLASLPAPGDDGTMEHRFQSTRQKVIATKIRAKTGTLTQPVTVSSLAGYLRHPEQGLIAFAIIENGVVGTAQPSVIDLKDRQDRAIAKLWDSL